MISLRKLFALICLIGLLSAALSPAAISILPAIITPILFCFGILLISFALTRPEKIEAPSSTYPSVVGLRAPPATS